MSRYNLRFRIDADGELVTPVAGRTGAATEVKLKSISTFNPIIHKPRSTFAHIQQPMARSNWQNRHQKRWFRGS